jgi:hypothetical protein
VQATLINLLCESRLFAVALLAELITLDSGKSEKVKRKLEEAGTRPIYHKHFYALTVQSISEVPSDDTRMVMFTFNTFSAT